ncbi:LysM peptidoglycan-binding domain-containing protein [Kineosporia sp. J2-2]|uniref:LysM peptidoglycan-binding domain-containing protein n=1 Tax=Kineosporia corallincola TaxID=2835133 RepID=A0ABS5TGS4_9ACTN|nr:LysM peptidoglycan-binding domain-containing protein [Kineosporia corallincola]MBT0769273.1 LysM peptidoglycan-binding domain-containing protein [Kineosporia corallincola]
MPLQRRRAVSRPAGAKPADRLSSRPVRHHSPQILPPLRLTRRGRIVFRAGGLLAATVAVLAGVLLLNRPAEAGSEAHEVSMNFHVVLPGETLWGIAGDIAPESDPRDTVADIVDLNALPGPAVNAGQRIALPGK